MSFTGKSPTLKRTRYTPQSTDPVNPTDGDFFFSDGTARAEGPWVYFDGDWQQVSTAGTFTDVNDLTFIPQSADPGSPTAGMVFYSNGTPREEGLWLYDGTNWIQLSGNARYQEFSLREYSASRVASTANVTIASLFAGSTIDGVVLADLDRVLLKNQSTASQNGVYVVHVNPTTPTRASDADTIGELNGYAAAITAGTANANTVWFQNAVLTSLSDNQSWSATPATQSFTVPDDVNVIYVHGCGGGGGGGGGNGVSVNPGVGGGGGGAGLWGDHTMKVTPADVLAITIGVGGNGGASKNAGQNGTSSTVVGTGIDLRFYPGGGGGSNTTAGGDTVLATGANSSGSNGGGGGASYSNGSTGGNDGRAWGSGGGGSAGAFVAGGRGGISPFESTGAAGGTSTTNTGGGGGGGSAFGIGGVGGNSGATGSAGSPALTGTGGGGGGGGGGNTGNSSGGRGGRGGAGFIRISW